MRGTHWHGGGCLNGISNGQCSNQTIRQRAEVSIFRYERIGREWAIENHFRK